MERRVPGDMTTDDALTYLNERLVRPITKRTFQIVRTWTGEPVAERGEGRLWFRRQELDAFLSEFGTDPDRWLSP